MKSGDARVALIGFPSVGKVSDGQCGRSRHSPYCLFGLAPGPSKTRLSQDPLLPSITLTQKACFPLPGSNSSIQSCKLSLMSAYHVMDVVLSTGDAVSNERVLFGPT